MLDLALRTTGILIMAWAAHVTLRRASAATRHLVLHAAVIAVLVAPVLAPIAPSFEVPVLTTLADASAAGVERMARETLLDRIPSRSVSAPSSAGTSTTAAVTLRSIAAYEPNASMLLAIVWLLGSAACAAWFALGWMAAAGQVRRAGPVDPAWQTELNDLCRKLHIRGDVRLRLVARHTSPIVTGLFKPSVLLPLRARDWDAARRRAVLLHELAHVQRGDCRVQALGQAACALYWFNPLMWMTFARLRVERERACDDQVLLNGLTPSTYASHLLDVARDLRTDLRPSAALAMARPSEIEGRLLAVLANNCARRSTARARTMIVALVAMITAAALGASSTSERPSDSPAALVKSASRFRVPLDSAGPEDRPAARASRAAAARTLQSSADEKSRERAVLDLIASDADEAIDPLRTALDDPSQDIREKAALGLALRSGSDVVPALLKALGDSNSQVREKAALGLALRRDDRATDALLAATGDPDSQVREKVAMALGTSGDARATAALNQLLADPDSQVREKASTGLRLLGTGAGASAEADSLRSGLRGMVAAFAGLKR